MERRRRINPKTYETIKTYPIPKCVRESPQYPELLKVVQEFPPGETKLDRTYRIACAFEDLGFADSAADKKEQHNA